VRRYVDTNAPANPCVSFAVSNATDWRAATTGAPVGAARVRQCHKRARKSPHPRPLRHKRGRKSSRARMSEVGGRKSLGGKSVGGNLWAYFLKLKMLGHIFSWAEIFGRKMFGRKSLGGKSLGGNQRRLRFRVFLSASRIRRATANRSPDSWASSMSSDGSTPWAPRNLPHQSHNPSAGKSLWRASR
jgi:hypothetical protein